ncbi:MAG: cupin domain-containing protein [Proteobacteria bacterium]|nr:cupin domain-containing protein [Pseudomonadota bacterium]
MNKSMLGLIALFSLGFAGALQFLLAGEPAANTERAVPKATANIATTRSGLTYQPIGKGIRWLVKSDVFLKTLVERSNYGNGDVEVAELHLPKVPKSGYVVQGLEHFHRSAEIFYVISGRMGHIINGKKHIIEPGQVGIVHGGEKIIHTVEGDEPVKAIVIWVPGGEADNLVENLRFNVQPIGKLLAD